MTKPLPNDDAQVTLDGAREAQGNCLGVRSFFAPKRLRYRLKRDHDGKLLQLDHVTIPCGNPQIAEDFYAGVLGADVMLRVDQRLLERMGWSHEQIGRIARRICR